MTKSILLKYKSGNPKKTLIILDVERDGNYGNEIFFCSENKKQTN